MSRLPNGLQGALQFQPPKPVNVQLIGLGIDQLVCLMASQQTGDPAAVVARSVAIIAETQRALVSGEIQAALQAATEAAR